MARWSCCIATWSLLAAGCPGSVDVDLFDPGRPVLRYDFTGFGTEIRDSIGNAHAHAVGGALLAGTGGLRLDGAGQCIELPSPLVSRLHSATIVAWLEWFGGACWQRVFDFGSSDGATGWPNNAPMSLFMTPSACTDGSFFAKGQVGTPNFMLRSGSPLPQDRLVQVALSVDGERRRAALFVDGAEVASATVPFALSQLADVHNELGCSQNDTDPDARIRYEEFRIYDRALGPEQLAHLARNGPNEL